MKKFSIFFLSLIALMVIAACTQDDDVVFIAQEAPERIVFTNNFSEKYALIKSANDNMVERFVWNEVDFGTATTITYELHGSTNTEFSNYEIMGSTSGNNLSITVSNLLNLAEEAGLDSDPETEAPNTDQVYFRVRAYAGEGEGNVLESISEPVSLTVMLPETNQDEGEEAKREFYLVGDATEAGWDPDNNNTPLFRDPENENIYYFEGRFAGGNAIEGFKLVEIPGQWQPQWGGTNGIMAVNSGDSEDPPAFTVADDGYYSLMINTDEMTYTWEEGAPNEANMQTNIGIIGDATAGGWDEDTDMIQSEFNPHIWHSTGIELSDGFVKFRADDAWDLDWGAETPISGQTTTGGPDIPVSAGTYNIWFNTLDGRYILIPQSEE